MRRLLLVCGLALLLGGCAWSRRENRPVWNAFEEHLVPDSTGAFYATLPLTVPGGVVAILTDTFIVHPVQVADDAWDDASDLWEKLDWRGEYYTQLGVLPFRAVLTPIVLVGSFLGRSAFDVRTDAEREAHAAAAETERRERLLEALALLATGTDRLSDLASLPPAPPRGWSPELEAAFQRALGAASPAGRLRLILYARTSKLAPAVADPALGLRDPEPIIRYEVLGQLAKGATLPRELIDALRNDPDPLVRSVARSRWP